MSLPSADEVLDGGAPMLHPQFPLALADVPVFWVRWNGRVVCGEFARGHQNEHRNNVARPVSCSQPCVAMLVTVAPYKIVRVVYLA